MTINSRQKGKRGELELAKRFREYGFDARRSQQYAGINGDADVVNVPGIHVECKRNERLNIHDAMDQAKRDKCEDEFPTVFHRKNNCEWLVTMRFEDWMQLYREWLLSMELVDGSKE